MRDPAEADPGAPPEIHEKISGPLKTTEIYFCGDIAET